MAYTHTFKNVYIRPVKLNDRKSCPTCQIKLNKFESIYSSGEYIRAKWRNIEYFCVHCFSHLDKRLKNEFDNLEYRGYQSCVIPNWIR